MGNNGQYQFPKQGELGENLGLYYEASKKINPNYKPTRLDSIEPEAIEYVNAFKNSLNNQVYLDIAKRLGIKDYNSINDYEQVRNALANGFTNGGGNTSSKGRNGNTLPAPNDGEYGNIITNTKYQGELGSDVANDYNSRTPSNPGGNPLSANALSKEIAQKTGQATTAADPYTQALKDLMIKQEDAYRQQLELQQRQLDAANAAYAEQQRQADALSRAYVPPASQTAQAPVFNGFGSSSSNTLSSLSIIGGRAFGGSSLSGLQIA